MRAVFAANWTDTDTAATLKIHFEDGSADELKVIAEKDLVDWWAPNKSYLIDPEKIGFIGNGEGIAAESIIHISDDKTK